MISLKQLFAVLYAIPALITAALMPIIYRYVVTHGPDWILSKDCAELALTCGVIGVSLFLSSMIFLTESFK